MRLLDTILTLEDLPAPPEGKTGWPWTEESESLAKRIPDALELPRITIITPSYNQGQFIEETIRSVLLQGYPDFEYIIIDGGSSDNSVEVIRKYEKWINYWVSEPDNGQTHAIQKGFDLSTGVLWNWINSDDLLEPNALQNIAFSYHKNPHATTYSGKMTSFGDIEPYIHHKRFRNATELACVWEGWPNPQPAIFLSSQACRQVNYLNQSLKYTMDYELYLRLSTLPDFEVYLIDELIARDRWHSATKTVSQAIPFKSEIIKVFDNFVQSYPGLLPKQWKKSSSLNRYHFELDCISHQSGKKISLTDFIKTSWKYFPYICNYRFFWIILLKKIIKAE